MSRSVQWHETKNADELLIAFADAHASGIYQIYKVGRGNYQAILWDGTSLFEFVHIADASTSAKAKVACEQHFASGEAQQHLGG